MAFTGCACPAPAALTAIPDSDCGERMGQIGGIAFQRAGYTWPTLAGSTIADLSQWQALMGATDGTKIVFTGKLDKPTLTPGEPNTDNDANNHDGAEYVVSFGATVYEAVVRNPSAAKISALSKLACETEVVAYFMQSKSEGGKIIHILDGTANKGIPIVGNIVISGVGNQGKGSADEMRIRFSVAYMWDADRKMTQPTFNAFTDL